MIIFLPLVPSPGAFIQTTRLPNKQCAVFLYVSAAKYEWGKPTRRVCFLLRVRLAEHALVWEFVRVLWDFCRLLRQAVDLCRDCTLKARELLDNHWNREERR
jgi:hypothetical protein